MTDHKTAVVKLSGRNALTRREAVVLRRILSLGCANYQGNGREDVVQIANKLRRAIAIIQTQERRENLAARAQKLTRDVGAEQRNKEARAWLEWIIPKMQKKTSLPRKAANSAD